MNEIAVESLDNIRGITFDGTHREDRAELLRLLRQALPVARVLVARSADLRGLGPISIAAAAALQSIAALMTAAAPKCSLAAPAADIDTTIDSNGNIIYRCRHHRPHEWDLSGKQLP